MKTTWRSKRKEKGDSELVSEWMNEWLRATQRAVNIFFLKIFFSTSKIYVSLNCGIAAVWMNSSEAEPLEKKEKEKHWTDCHKSVKIDNSSKLTLFIVVQ